MNDKIQFLALEAAMMTHRSLRLVPLETIKGNYKTVGNATFELPDGTDAVCMSRKFNSIEEIEEELSKADKTYYVYQVCEFDVYGMDLKKTGNKSYSLRACLRQN
jgi:hypothetical protein